MKRTLKCKMKRVKFFVMLLVAMFAFSTPADAQFGSSCSS